MALLELAQAAPRTWRITQFAPDVVPGPGVWSLPQDKRVDADSAAPTRGPMYPTLRTNLSSYIMQGLHAGRDTLGVHAWPAGTTSFPSHGQVATQLRAWAAAVQERMASAEPGPRFERLNAHVTAVQPAAMGEALPELPPYLPPDLDVRAWARAQGMAERQADLAGAARRRPAAAPSSSSSCSSDAWPRWKIEARAADGSTMLCNADRVMLCTGHYDAMYIPRMPGDDALPRPTALPPAQAGQPWVMHAAWYSQASHFHGRRVLVVGAGPSGTDLATDVAKEAAQVWVCSRKQPALDPRAAQHAEPGTLIPAPALQRIVRVDDAGIVAGLADGSTVLVDTIAWCTGYDVQLPMLPGGWDTTSPDFNAAAAWGWSTCSHEPDHCAPWAAASQQQRARLPAWSEHGAHEELLAAALHTPPGDVVRIVRRRVHPLWRHTLHATLPSLAVIGLPWKVNPMAAASSQAAWVVDLWQRPGCLPDVAQRVRQAYEASVGDSQRLLDAHQLGAAQWEWMAASLGMATPPPLPEEPAATWLLDLAGRQEEPTAALHVSPHIEAAHQAHAALPAAARLAMDRHMYEAVSKERQARPIMYRASEYFAGDARAWAATDIAAAYACRQASAWAGLAEWHTAAGHPSFQRVLDDTGKLLPGVQLAVQQWDGWCRVSPVLDDASSTLSSIAMKI